MSGETVKNRRFRNLTQMERYLSVIIIAYIIIVAVKNPTFFRLGTLFDMLRSSAGTLILGVGVLMVLISGGIDVSFTSIAIVAGYCAVVIMQKMQIDNIAFAMALSAVLGILMGSVNALLIHFFNLQTLIVTLGTSSIFYGTMTTFLGTKSIPVSAMPKSLVAYGSNNIFSLTENGSTYGLTVFIFMVAAIYIVSYFILYRTMLGRSIFALGNDEESAKRAGINIFGTRLFIYCFMGCLSGIMGIIYFSELKMINPVSLVGTELMIIAAVVIGGAKLTGGEGTIFGTILGIAIIQLFKYTLVFLGLSTSWNDFFTGVVLLFSVGILSYRQRVRNRKDLKFID